MTTIPVLMMLGNRLCMSLLKESQLALKDADWKYVSECLREFELQFKRQTNAEDGILFPRLAALSQAYESIISELRKGQENIALHTRRALLRAANGEKLLCAEATGQLMELLGDYWASERRLLTLVTQEVENEILVDLAEKLKASLDSDDSLSDLAAGKANLSTGLHESH